MNVINLYLTINEAKMLHQLLKEDELSHGHLRNGIGQLIAQHKYGEQS